MKMLKYNVAEVLDFDECVTTKELYDRYCLRYGDIPSKETFIKEINIMCKVGFLGRLNNKWYVPRFIRRLSIN